MSNEEYETTTQAAVFINKDKVHCQEETSTTKIYLGFQNYQLWSMVRVSLVPYVFLDFASNTLLLIMTVYY